MRNYLQGKKTYLVSASMVVYGVMVVGWTDHGFDWKSAFPFIINGLIGISGRAAIAKVNTGVK